MVGGDNMKRYTQIVDNKAYWIFDTEVEPVFAPNIVLVDITGRDDIKEGWDYDVKTNTFSESSVPITVPKSSLEELQQDNLILMDALATAFEQILNLEAKIDALGGTI